MRNAARRDAPPGNCVSHHGSRGLAGHPRLELLVLPQTGRNLVGLAAALESSHLHPVDRGLARLGNEHVRLVAFRYEPPRDGVSLAALAHGRELNGVPGRGGCALDHGRWSGGGLGSCAYRRLRGWRRLPLLGRCDRGTSLRGADAGVLLTVDQIVEVVVVWCRLGRCLVSRWRGRGGRRRGGGRPWVSPAPPRPRRPPPPPPRA